MLNPTCSTVGVFQEDVDGHNKCAANCNIIIVAAFALTGLGPAYFQNAESNFEMRSPAQEALVSQRSCVNQGSRGSSHLNEMEKGPESVMWMDKEKTWSPPLGSLHLLKDPPGDLS